MHIQLICVTLMQVQVGAAPMRAAAAQHSRNNELSAQTQPETNQLATSGLSQQSTQEAHCQDSEIAAKTLFHHQVASAEPFSRRVDASSGPILPDGSALQPAASNMGRGRAPLGGPSARGHGRGRHRISLA